MRHYLILLTCGCLCVASNTFAQKQSQEDSQTESNADNQQLLKLLESDSFDAREEAMQKLISRGPEIIDDINAFAGKGDEDLRYRCQGILKEIANGQHRIQQVAFLKGDVKQLVRNVSSWKRFEQIMGNTEESRKFFLLMQNDGGELLSFYERSPSACSDRIIELYMENNQIRKAGGRGLDDGVYAAVIFVASDEKVSLDAKAISYTTSLCYNAKTIQFAQTELFHKLLGKLVTRKNATDIEMYQYARLSKYFQLKEGRIAALNMIASKTAHGSYRATSLIDLGTSVGTKEDIEAVEKLINDDTLLSGSSSKTSPKATYKLGDTALAMAAKLAGQNTDDYGFTSYYKGRTTRTTINYRHFGFLSDEQRAAARKKWFDSREKSEKNK